MTKRLTYEEKERRRYERFIENQIYRGSLGGKAKGKAYFYQRKNVVELWETTALTKKEIAEKVGVSTGFVSKYTKSILRERKEREYLKYEHQDNLAKIRELELKVSILKKELEEYVEKYGDIRQVKVRKKL